MRFKKGGGTDTGTKGTDGVGRQMGGEKGTVVRGVGREQVRREMGYRSGKE